MCFLPLNHPGWKLGFYQASTHTFTLSNLLMQDGTHLFQLKRLLTCITQALVINTFSEESKAQTYSSVHVCKLSGSYCEALCYRTRLLFQILLIVISLLKPPFLHSLLALVFLPLSFPDAFFPYFTI